MALSYLSWLSFHKVTVFDFDALKNDRSLIYIIVFPTLLFTESLNNNNTWKHCLLAFVGNLVALCRL